MSQLAPDESPGPRVTYPVGQGISCGDAIAIVFGENVELLPAASVHDALEAVDAGHATHAVFPVENSIDGSVGPSTDLMLEHDLAVTGETIVSVHHCLIGQPRTKLERIRRVYAEPHAVSECRTFLDQHPAWMRVPAFDAAGSVGVVSEGGRKDEAAIGSSPSAATYGLAILADGIQDTPATLTRFFVLEKHAREVPGADKTSIAFVAKNVPGSLHACPAEIASRHINHTEIESRPRRERLWNYIVFADFEGSMEDPVCREAVGALVNTAGFVKVLGSYRRAPLPGDRSPPG